MGHGLTKQTVLGIGLEPRGTTAARLSFTFRPQPHLDKSANGLGPTYVLALCGNPGIELRDLPVVHPLRNLVEACGLRARLRWLAP
jgi:hypothetical protein